MGNNKYIRGSNFERLLLDKLRAKGYDGLRSAGSHTCCDLLVWDKGGTMYAIQCKTSQTEINLSNLIWEDSIRELTSLPDNFIKVLCIKQHRKIIQCLWYGSNLGWEIKTVFDIK